MTHKGAFFLMPPFDDLASDAYQQIYFETDHEANNPESIGPFNDALRMSGSFKCPSG
jgi:hypothetical protein